MLLTDRDGYKQKNVRQKNKPHGCWAIFLSAIFLSAIFLSAIFLSDCSCLSCKKLALISLSGSDLVNCGSAYTRLGKLCGGRANSTQRDKASKGQRRKHTRSLSVFSSLILCSLCPFAMKKRLYPVTFQVVSVSRSVRKVGRRRELSGRSCDNRIAFGFAFDCF